MKKSRSTRILLGLVAVVMSACSNGTAPTSDAAPSSEVFTSVPTTQPSTTSIASDTTASATATMVARRPSVLDADLVRFVQLWNDFSEAVTSSARTAISLDPAMFVRSELSDGSVGYVAHISPSSVLGVIIDEDADQVLRILLGSDPDGNDSAVAVIAMLAIASGTTGVTEDLAQRYRTIALDPIGEPVDTIATRDNVGITIYGIEGANAEDPLVIVVAAPRFPNDAEAAADAIATQRALLALLADAQ